MLLYLCSIYIFGKIFANYVLPFQLSDSEFVDFGHLVQTLMSLPLFHTFL